MQSSAKEEGLGRTGQAMRFPRIDLHELCCRRFGADRMLGCHEKELNRLRRVTVEESAEKGVGGSQ